MTKKTPQNTHFTIRNSTAEFLIFTTDSHADNISLHLKNIFKEHELDKNSVAEEFSVTASDLDLPEEKVKIKILDKSEISKNKQKWRENK